MGNVFWKPNKEMLEEERQDGLQRERERKTTTEDGDNLLLLLSQPNTDVLRAPGGECRGEQAGHWVCNAKKACHGTPFSPSPLSAYTLIISSG